MSIEPKTEPNDERSDDANPRESTASTALLAHLKHAFHAVESQMQQLDSSTQKLQQSEAEITKLTAQVAEEQKKRSESDEKVAQLERFVVEQKKHIERTQECVEHERSLNMSLSSQLQQMETIVKEVENQQNDFEAERNSYQEKILAFKEQVSSLKKQALSNLTTSKQALEKVALENRNLKQKHSRHLSRVSSLESQLNSTQKALNSKQQEMEHVLVESKKNTSFIGSLKKQVQEQSALQKKHLAMNDDSVKQIATLTQRNAELESNLSTSTELVKQLTEKVSTSRESHEAEMETISSELAAAMSKQSQAAKQIQAMRKALKAKDTDIESSLAATKEKHNLELKKLEESYKCRIDALRQDIHSERKSRELQKKTLSEKVMELEALMSVKQKLKAALEEALAKLKKEENAVKSAKVALSRAQQAKEKLTRESEKQCLALQKAATKANKAKENCEVRIKQLEKDSLEMCSKVTEMRAEVSARDEQRRHSEKILTDQLKELKELLKVEKDKREEAEKMKLEAEQAHGLELQSLQHGFDRKNTEMAHQYAQLQTELDAYADRRRSYETMVKQLEQKLEELQAEKVDLQASAREATMQVKDCESRCRKIEEEKASLQEENETLHLELRRVGDTLSVSRKEAIEAKNESKHFLQRLETAESAFHVLRTEMQSAERENASKNFSWSSKYNRLEEEVNSLKQERSRANADVQLLQSRLSAAIQQIGELREQKEKSRAEHVEDVKALELTVENLSEERDAKAMDVIRCQQAFEVERRKIHSNAKQEKEEMHNAMEGLKWRVDALTTALEDAKSAQESAQDKLKRLEVENQSIKQSEARLMKINQELSSRTPQSYQRPTPAREEHVFRSIKDFIRKKYPQEADTGSDTNSREEPEDDNTREEDEGYLRELFRDSSGRKSMNQTSSEEEVVAQGAPVRKIVRKRLSKVKPRSRRPRSAIARRR